jgi:hypothetical protein
MVGDPTGAAPFGWKNVRTRCPDPVPPFVEVSNRVHPARSWNPYEGTRGEDMKYVMLFTGVADEALWQTLPPEEMERIMGEMDAWWEQHAASGAIIGGERLQGGSTATTFRMQDGVLQTIDGPFIEAKEEVGGFGILEVADLDAALAIARTWPALQVQGESIEVRPAYEM